jgi:hypothetical protein
MDGVFDDDEDGQDEDKGEAKSHLGTWLGTCFPALPVKGGHGDYPSRPAGPRRKKEWCFRIVRGSSSSGSTSCTTRNDASDVDRTLTALAELADG